MCHFHHQHIHDHHLIILIIIQIIQVLHLMLCVNHVCILYNKEIKIEFKYIYFLFIDDLASFLHTSMPIQSTHLSSTAASSSSGANPFWDRF